MSIRLTKTGVPMADSYSLKLVFGTSKVHDQIACYLSEALKKKGYESASPSVLHFLSALECGVNYGSEIARNLGVSRQMVAKTVKELCRVNYLKQIEGVGKQKQILFTERGEHLISDTRKLLARLDDIISEAIGQKQLQATIGVLEKIQVILETT